MPHLQHPIQPWHCEGGHALVLPHGVLAPRNLLVGAGDDEIGVVHGNHVSRELRTEVVLLVIALPVGTGATWRDEHSPTPLAVQ